MEENRYLCIDLKSFYASVECVERGLDPLKASLVVADLARGDNTICLAVSPALKKRGVAGRCRLREIPQSLACIVARPRMGLYIRYSAEIYKIYLSFFSKEDVHVYSVDEVFIDAGRYRMVYGPDCRALAKRVIEVVRQKTGIPAACGIGPNLYLAKIALDVMAKREADGIGELSRQSYIERLWDHKPLTDFWRIGRGTAKSLARCGIYSMRQLAAADEEMLYRKFGVDAELLIDHAWGRETATMSDVKNYVPRSRGLSSGQVLPAAYGREKTRLLIREMIDALCLELAERRLATDSLGLSVGYANREHGSGSIAIPFFTSSRTVIRRYADELYERIALDGQKARKLTVSFNRVEPESCGGFDLFNSAEEAEREKKEAEALLAIRRRYGLNAIFRASSLEDYSTALERNGQIGGHRA